MSSLDGQYLSQLRQRDRDENDRWMAQQLALTKPAQADQQSGQMGLGEEFSRGVVRGGANVAGSLGTLLKAGGLMTGSNMLTQAGESMATHWAQVAEKNAPSEQAKQSLWDNPWAVLNPHWLTASVAESLPSLAASMVPAGAAGSALSIGGKLIGWTPAVALKLARIGAAVTGGAIGGGIEGASTFEEVKRRGGSDQDALQALAFMGLASAGLNALSLGQAFRVAGRPGLLPLAKRAGVAGASEGLTEWLEEPTEAVILGEDWNGIMEAAKRGLNVIPAAALTGAGANVAVGGAKNAKAGVGSALKSEVGAVTLGGDEGGTTGGGDGEQSGPSGPKEPPTLTVNLKYVDGDRAFKDMTAAVNQLNADRMASDRKTRGVNEMRAEGHSRLPDLQTAMTWNPENAPASELPGTLRALADWRDAATQHLKDVRETAKEDPGAKWDVWRAFTVVGHLAANVEAGESILGRGMRMQQEASLSVNAPFDAREVMRLADTMRDAGDVNVDAFLARLDELSARQQKVMAKQSVTLLRSGQNALYEAWINGLLSGPQTHVVNPLSSLLTTLWAMPERAIAAQLHVGTEPGVVKGEATAMLRGLTEGFMDGLRIARLAWTDFESGGTAEGFLNASKMDIPAHAITSGAFGQDPNGSVGKALDYIGTGVRFPSRLMASTDAFFKAVNYRMELKALSLRQGLAEGLDGDALARRIQQIEANPPAEVKERAEQFMLLQTFQNDLGETGQALMKLRDASGIGRLILPFVKTPTNIAKWAVYRTPGLNMLSSQFRADLAEAGPTRDLALARMSMGVLVASSVTALAAAGLVTGGGPSDPDLKRQLRETGWQPYSLKVGDTYYAYNRLDPIGAVVGLVADTSEIIGQIPDPQADNIAMATVLALSKTMVNKTYLQGLSDAIEAISNPDKGATKYVARFAQTLVPTGVRTVERTIDPTVREARGVLESIQAVVPGWSSSLPPKRNLFGEPIMLQGGLGPDLISPIYTSQIKDDAVSAEIARHRIDIAMPSRVLEGRRPADLRMTDRGIEGVQLSPKEYDRYVSLAGENLKADLERLVNSPSYASQSDGPDGGKALLIRHTIYAHRQVARAKLMSEDEGIQKRHVDFLERRAGALAGSLSR